MEEARWGAVSLRNACPSAQHSGQIADYPKGWPFPTKRLATEDNARGVLCCVNSIQVLDTTPAGMLLLLEHVAVRGEPSAQ